MYNRDHGNEFACIRERLNETFRRMSGGPFAHLYHASAMQRNLSDIRWMLNHNFYPAPGHVSFVISALRKEKFRVVRENGCRAAPAAELQLMIDTLKDIRRFLQLVTRYEQEGDIIKINRQPGWGSVGSFLLLAIIFGLVLAQGFILSGHSPSGVYLCGVAVFFALSFILENKPLLYSFAGLTVFTLCGFISWAGS